MVGRRTWTGSWWLCAATSEAGPADGCCLRVCKGYVKAAHIQDNPQPSEARAVMPSTVHGRMACRNAVNGPILNSWSCSVQCGGCRVMVARTYFVNAPLCVRKRSDERCVASQGNRRVAAQASSTSALRVRMRYRCTSQAAAANRRIAQSVVAMAPTDVIFEYSRTPSDRLRKARVISPTHGPSARITSTKVEREVQQK
jgi:hypothetical protein